MVISRQMYKMVYWIKVNGTTQELKLLSPFRVDYEYEAHKKPLTHSYRKKQSLRNVNFLNSVAPAVFSSYRG